MPNPVQWLRNLYAKDNDDHTSRLKVAAYCIAAIIVLIVLWKVPQWQAHQPKEQFTQENAARTTLAQILGGTVLLGGLFTSVKTFGLSRQGHITDRFTKAIEQLGKTDGTVPNIEVRLGAIYALERIALDSPRDHWTIMEILTAYVRQNAPYRLGTSIEEDNEPRTDIQAIITILGRRRICSNRERPDQSLNLSKSNLNRADFRMANLERVNLLHANLEGAYLQKTNLRGAMLSGAVLDEAYLQEANLEEANLVQTDLRDAGLWRANLKGANLTVARLKGAVLSEANLVNVRNLTADQIRSTAFWESAHFSPGLLDELGISAEDAELTEDD